MFGAGVVRAKKHEAKIFQRLVLGNKATPQTFRLL